MIDTRFVHACDDICMIESAYEDNMREINMLVSTLDVLHQQKKDMKSFGIFTESKEEYFEESVTDVISKLGEKILQIIQQFKDFMSDIMRKWKERSWAKKDDIQKLREIERRDPKSAAKLQVALQKGDIDMNGFTDINDFFKNCDSVLAEIEKKNADPKSIKGKWMKAKDCLEKNEKTIKAVGTALGVVVSAAGLVITYQKFKTGKATAIERETCTIQKEAENRLKKIRRQMEVLSEMEKKKGDPYAGSKAAILADMAAEVDRTTSVNCNKRLQLVRKIESGFFRSIHSIKPGKDKDVYDSLKKGYNKEIQRLNNVRVYTGTELPDPGIYQK